MALDLKTFLAAIITITFWASSFAGIRASLPFYSPGSLAFLRFLTAGVVIGVFALRVGIKSPDIRDLPFIFLAGFLGIAFYHVSLNYGELTVTAGSASFIIGTVPIFSILLAYFIFQEKLCFASFVGITISFAGVTLIAMGEGNGPWFKPDSGALLILAAAIATSVYFVFQRPYLDKYGSIQFTAYVFWAGLFFMCIFAPGFFHEISMAPLNATLSVIYLGIFPSAISYVTWAYALKRTNVSNVTSFLYVSPVLACLIAWLWLGETPAALSLAGGALALSGVIIVNLK